MAKIKPMLGELSGKLAGVVFSHNSAGAYVRQKSTPVNGNSTRQQLARQRLAYLSANWQNLTDAQRTLWQTYAAANLVTDALGNQVALTGQQAFVQLNARRLNLGASTIMVSCPSTGNTSAPVSATCAITSPGTIVVTGFATPAAGAVVEVWAAVAGTAGRNPNVRAAKFCGNSVAAAASPATIASAVPFTSGQYVNLYLRGTDQYGQSTVFTKVRVQAA